MKIAFICGSIAPGRDGVGDYTAALASDLTRQGHACCVASLMDGDDDPVTYPFPYLRLKADLDWGEKAARLKAWLTQEGPDVISLQFVPYAYDARGLPFGFAKWLKGVAGDACFHVMFHELWVAAEQGASFKNCIIGIIQKQLIARFLHELNPVCIHTTNLVYQELIARLGWKAALLPLFCNVAPAETPVSPWLLYQAKGWLVEESSRNDWLVAVVFGTVHPSWDSGRALSLLEEAATISGKRPILLLVGRNGPQGDLLQERIRSDHPGLLAVATGMLDVPELTGVLQSADFAFSAAPWALAGKSSAGMTLLGHGLPLVFTDDSWRLRRGPTPLPDEEDGSYLAGSGMARRIAEGLVPARDRPSLSSVAQKLYQGINTGRKGS